VTATTARSWRSFAAAVLLMLGLAGCASDPRYKDGLAWVQWQEAERARLEAQGFPQFSFF
jgi:hypothetical protein